MNGTKKFLNTPPSPLPNQVYISLGLIQLEKNLESTKIYRNVAKVFNFCFPQTERRLSSVECYKWKAVSESQLQANNFYLPPYIFSLSPSNLKIHLVVKPGTSPCVPQFQQRLDIGAYQVFKYQCHILALNIIENRCHIQ